MKVVIRKRLLLSVYHFPGCPTVTRIRPPPSVVRRNSVTTPAPATPESSNDRDLISFHSPTGPKTSDDLADFTLRLVHLCRH